MSVFISEKFPLCLPFLAVIKKSAVVYCNKRISTSGFTPGSWPTSLIARFLAVINIGIPIMLGDLAKGSVRSICCQSGTDAFVPEARMEKEGE